MKEQTQQYFTPRHDALQSRFTDKTAIDYVIKKVSGKENTSFETEFERPVYNDIAMEDYILGYWDVFITYQEKDSQESNAIGIEIKPELNSVGEAIRQLKRYKKHEFGRTTNERYAGHYERNLKKIDLVIVCDFCNLLQSKRKYELFSISNECASMLKNENILLLLGSSHPSSEWSMLKTTFTYSNNPYDPEVVLYKFLYNKETVDNQDIVKNPLMNKDTQKYVRQLRCSRSLGESSKNS